MTISTRYACAAIAMISIFMDTSAKAGSANVQITTRVPLVCEASIVSSNVVSLSPLLINARVRQACNSAHELSVTYLPVNLTRPNLLLMTFAGQDPVSKTPGDVSFGNFQSTSAVKFLRIFYAGGTLSERQQLAATIHIAVTPL